MIGISCRRNSWRTVYLRRASMMDKPDPSAESSGSSPAQPETPEQTRHAAGTGGNPAGPGHNKRPGLPIPLHHPVVLEEQARRASDIQLRIAD